MEQLLCSSNEVICWAAQGRFCQCHWQKYPHFFWFLTLPSVWERCRDNACFCASPCSTRPTTTHGVFALMKELSVEVGVFLWFSDQVPGNKECTSLQIETLLFMQEARSAASGVCSLDISSCFFYILHASCTSCFWYLLCTLQKGQWPAVCFFFWG